MMEEAIELLENQYKKYIINNDNIINIKKIKTINRFLPFYSLRKFKKILNYCHNNSEYYQYLLRKNSIDLKLIKSRKDIQKIPFTSSFDILDPEKFFCVPKKLFVKTYQTSGSTGKPKITYLTEKDVQNQIDRNIIGFKLLYSIKPQDSIRIYYGPQYAVFFCAYQALKKIGSHITYSQKRLTAKQEYNILQKKKVTAIIANPSYFFSMSAELAKQYDLKKLGVKTIILGAEPLHNLQRERFEQIWNADIYSAYGINEVGVSIGGECTEKNGIHVTETDFYVEVIDPKTKHVIDDGKQGEIVITTLNREGMPLIRYRTNDLGYIIPSDCPCGLPFKRIIITSRKDDMIILGHGEKMYPMDIERKLYSLPQIINYQMVIERKNGKDLITLDLEAGNISNKEHFIKKVYNALIEIGQIRRAIFESKLVEIKKINIIESHSQNKNHLKQKKIIDKRKFYENR